MTTDHEQSGSQRGQLAAPPVGVFGKLLTIAAGIVVLVVAFMFSLVALGVVLIVGVLFFAYLKWKTRHLPRDLRDLAEQMQQQAARPGSRPQPGGRVIEGEVLRGNADEVAPESSTGSQQPNRNPTRDDG
ncbi:MAG TPA: hypothetical protein PL117_04565 [Accumulibacter sp.]|uniref:hypothetical protein n=1 Tax=Accumulibacter sp. TaxID=2053492 RepID=UPI000EBC15F5|nr:hypothetical protein [Accumulibacter sp.]HCZ14301.1 hypothetical protein [Accumulibacter sp.]HRF72025.1 hypothetical protein [Accumulibacter sp.]